MKLYERTADYVNLSDSDWHYACMSYTELYQDLLSPTGTCWMAASAIEVKQADIASGVQLTWPVYKEGECCVRRAAAQLFCMHMKSACNRVADSRCTPNQAVYYAQYHQSECNS